MWRTEKNENIILKVQNDKLNHLKCIKNVSMYIEDVNTAIINLLYYFSIKR